ncbi:hypothetical protein NHH03_22495 [Stieleria sp. TO1_6]|uniref:serine/threonine protein kinase n=1 Tax=Stieleria tagensis TaxID=2956795 RepID=UPI00209B1CFF|nr:hypothetical protein [Stieleria tagensis]MCO8124526.1 hypothetical protein [Stieleria tagensis]
MSIAQSEFWSRLVQSGVLSGDDTQRYSAAFAKQGDADPSSDAGALAAFLVRAGLLTKFQAGQLLGEQPPMLRIGSFVITSDQPIQPFSHWLPVQRDASAPADGLRNGFLLRIPLAGLDETRRHWLAVHGELGAATLQPIELSGGAQAQDAEQTVLVFSPLPEGGSLCKVLQTNPRLSSRKTVRIGIDLAAALQAMHHPGDSKTGIAHGAVGADHVWVTPKGHAVLLRDPSSPPRPPLADMSTSWIDRIEPAARYSAPELAAANAVPTPASDIYSLGCLLFSLYVGRPACAGDDNQQLLAAHANETPAELEQAMEQGAAADPLLRVLAYAMAKDPAARFASATALADALSRAGELAASKKRSGKPKTTAAVKETPAPETSAPATSAPETSAPETIAPVGEQAGASTTETPPPQRPPTVSPPTAAPPTAAPPAAAPMVPQSEQDLPQSAAEVAGETPQIQTTDSVPVETQSPDQLVSSAESTAPPASQPPLRRRRRRNKNRIPLLMGMMVLPLLMLGLAIVLRGRGPEEPPPRPRPRPGVANRVPEVRDSRRVVATPDQPALVNGYEIVDSDRLLWVPPYPADSPPPSLELLPPGPAGIISIPLARVVSSADMRPLTDSLAPELESIQSMASKRSGVSIQQIQRCTAGLFPGVGGWPEVALTIELTEPMALSDLVDKWGAAESRTPEGVTLYAGEDLKSDAYFIGDGEKGKLAADALVKRFAVGSLDRIREVAENNGGSIPLVRSMQTLWDQTSEQSDLVALMTPNFLFADGREMLAAAVPEFRAPLKQWLIPDVAAVSLTATARDAALYVEMREIPSGGATGPTLLRSFRDTLARWPDWADSFILNSVPDPSWRLLATRLPLMLRFVAQQTRSTIDGETVVASTYLPIDAGAQVTLATLLAMNTPSGGGVDLAQAPEVKPLTVDQMLDRPMSISFLQLSLQFAVDAVVEEFEQSLPPSSSMPKLRIVGADLEKAGITQNQQIRNFEYENQPLRKVLTDLVLGANSDKTATGPADEKQVLIWVVHPQGKSPAETEILITTRAAATAGNYVLPPEFVP